MQPLHSMSAKPIPSQENNPDLFQPLYPKSDISVCAALCAIMYFCSNNRLSFTATAQLLQLLQLICPSPNKIPTSLFKFKKFFQQFQVSYEHQQFCMDCLAAKADCQCQNSPRQAHMVNYPIDKQLQCVLSRKYYMYACTCAFQQYACT